jgi:hypothetical protein
MACSIAGVWREARDPPQLRFSQRRGKEATLRTSGQELGFQERQAKFSAFVDGIRRAKEIFGSRSAPEGNKAS